MRKIIDAHCHINPSKISERAVEGIRDFYQLGDTFSVGDNDGTAETLLKIGAGNGVVHYLCHSVATVPAQVRSINEFIAGEQAAHPDLITGFGTLHPDSDDIGADLEHLIGSGLKGVKLHPDFQQFALDEDRGYKLGEIIEAAGIPVLLHCGDRRYERSNPAQLKKFIEAFPNLTIIGAHLAGWKYWEEAAGIFPGTPNLYLDSSSSLAWLDRGKARDIIRMYGADRVMFGTDYPMWNMAEEIGRVEALGLTEEEEDQIFFGTAAKLLNIGKRTDYK